MGEITGLITRAREGDSAALNKVFHAVYPDLRRIAHSRLRRGFPDPDLDTTALVHECYLKLRGTERLQATDRAHFLAYAASAMRSIIVDIARAKNTARRGGGAVHVELDDDQGGDPAAELEVLRVNEVLGAVATLDPRLVRIVEMRYFAEMGDAEIAQALGINERTVRRDWEKARAVLAQALKD